MHTEIEILLIEDNPHDVELTLYAFEKHDFAQHIKVARDGAEALELIFGTPEPPPHSTGLRPRLILLDLKLPRLDGVQVLERLKTDPRSRSIPVVVLSSSMENSDIERCYELGANSYIVKPVDFAQFVEAAQQLGSYWLRLNQAPTPPLNGLLTA